MTGSEEVCVVIVILSDVITYRSVNGVMFFFKKKLLDMAACISIKSVVFYTFRCGHS